MVSPPVTSRLRLRPVELDDAAFLLELMNEPAYHRFIGDRGLRTVADAAAYITAKFTASYRAHGYGLYLVEKADDGTPLGICGLVKRDVLAHPDIGFAFRASYQGQGYAREAAAATLEHARTGLKLRRLHGVTAADNTRSMRLLEQLGLQYERDIQLPGAAAMSRLYTRDF